MILVVMVLAAVISGINMSKKKAERQEKIEAKERQIADFTPSVSITGHLLSYRLAIDQARRKILIVKPDEAPLLIPFEQVLSVTSKEGDSVILSKSTSRMIGGALAGGLLAGGAGAVVGGLSGNQSVDKKIHLIQVSLKLRDLSRPSVEIDCYNPRDAFGGGEMDYGSPLHKTCSAEAQRIVDMISVVIDLVDKEDQKSSSAPADADAPVEALARLVSMLEKGYISHDEFLQQKKRLLDSANQ